MSLPRVVFNKDSLAEARSQALLHLEQWLDLGSVSAVKTQVIRAVINYAKRKLIEGPFSFTDLSHFTTCEAIFNQKQLPDLLFLQQVIHQLSNIRDETSELKKAVLSMALNYKRPLLLASKKYKQALGFFKQVQQTKEQADRFVDNPETNKRKLK